MNFLFLFAGVVLSVSSFAQGDGLTAMVESCPNNSIAPVVHSPQCFTCPYIGSFHNNAGKTAHICFEQSSTSQAFKCIYETAGYTNSDGEVVLPGEIGQCLYTDQGYVLHVDQYGSQMAPECPSLAPKDMTCGQ